MIVAEGPRDRARRETQLELNWSVLGRAFEREDRREGGWRTSRIFLGFLWAETGRAKDRSWPTEGPASRNQCDIFCGRRKNSSKRASTTDPFLSVLRLIRESTINSS